MKVLYLYNPLSLRILFSLAKISIFKDYPSNILKTYWYATLIKYLNFMFLCTPRFVLAQTTIPLSPEVKLWFFLQFRNVFGTVWNGSSGTGPLRKSIRFKRLYVLGLVKTDCISESFCGVWYLVWVVKFPMSKVSIYPNPILEF